MSNRLVNLVDQARIGNSLTKAILRKIADQSNDAGTGVWSSHEYLAWVVESTRPTVAGKCKELKDMGLLDWESRSGSTNVYSIDVDVLVKLSEPYKDRIEKMEAVIERVSAEITPDGDGVSAQGTPPVSVENTTCQQGEHKSLYNPNEPTYIDDKDGVPDELQMEWDTFVNGWQYYFPTKTQPRRTNATLLRKFKTRMKSTDWRTNWKQAVKTASRLKWAHSEGWFKVEWILHNDENIFKLLDGTFDFKSKQPLTSTPSSGNIGTHMTPEELEAWQNRRNK
jgi:hypothetical protein